LCVLPPSESDSGQSGLAAEIRTRIASAGFDGSVRIWRTETAELLAARRAPLRAAVGSIAALSPSVLVCSSLDGEMAFLSNDGASNPSGAGGAESHIVSRPFTDNEPPVVVRGQPQQVSALYAALMDEKSERLLLCGHVSGLLTVWSTTSAPAFTTGVSLPAPVRRVEATKSLPLEDIAEEARNGDVDILSSVAASERDAEMQRLKTTLTTMDARIKELETERTALMAELVQARQALAESAATKGGTPKRALPTPPRHAADTMSR
jgi:hypothetical protein